MISLDVSWKSLNKHGEELCGDSVGILKNDESDIFVLSDGMGSGVKANILSTLTLTIMGTMLKDGASIKDCVETVATTLPVCSVRRVAYSTFIVLQVFKNGDAYLVEYDSPGCVLIRDGRVWDIPYEIKEIEGKTIREWHFKVQLGDYFVLLSDGVTLAGTGGKMPFGWGWSNASKFIEDACQTPISAPRLTSLVSKTCKEFYNHRPGDDTTTAVIHVVERKNVNILTGPPADKENDPQIVADFMAEPGKTVVSGGTSATIVSRILNKKLNVSLIYNDPDIPPTATMEGIDLVTEGVLTLNRVAQLLEQYNTGDLTGEFFERLDADNGASLLAKMLLEDCTHVNLFVGKAMNSAHQTASLPFDLSIRMRLVEKIQKECQVMGKTVTVTYY